MLAPVFS